MLLVSFVNILYIVLRSLEAWVRLSGIDRRINPSANATALRGLSMITLSNEGGKVRDAPRVIG
jgi:hypothetical protein